VSEGLSDEIKIHLQSDPVSLAYHFCKKHKIAEKTMFKLMKHIDESKNQAIAKLESY
jgi:hypothetical protein